MQKENANQYTKARQEGSDKSDGLKAQVDQYEQDRIGNRAIGTVIGKAANKLTLGYADDKIGGPRVGGLKATTRLEEVKPNENSRKEDSSVHQKVDRNNNE